MLQDKDHSDVVDRLNAAVDSFLVPFWKREDLNKMLYIDVLKMFKGIIAIQSVKSGARTVEGRIAQLRREGFRVFEKPREI